MQTGGIAASLLLTPGITVIGAVAVMRMKNVRYTNQMRVITVPKYMQLVTSMIHSRQQCVTSQQLNHSYTAEEEQADSATGPWTVQTPSGISLSPVG